MIDQRLLCVASMVRNGALLADIGTDHAYLPVYLMQQGRIARAIAADIGEGPAASARAHIQEAGFEKCIEVRVCDGLSGVAPQEVTDIVIAGMGGETIIHILSEAPWVKTGEIRLVLQPMTKTVELRTWLLQNGFTIEEEHLINDTRHFKNHLYCVMAATFTAAPPPSSPLAPFIGALSYEEGLPYFKKQEKYLLQRLAGLRHAGQTEAAMAVEELAIQLVNYIKEGMA